MLVRCMEYPYIERKQLMEEESDVHYTQGSVEAVEVEKKSRHTKENDKT